MKKRFLSLLMAFVLLLTACGTTGGDTKKEESKGESTTESKENANVEIKEVNGMEVAFIPKLTGNAFFEAANNGAQKYAEKVGFKVNYMGDSTASVSAQVAVINQAVAAGVDAICISTVDAAGVADALKAAKDAGIIVTTWDSDSNPEDRSIMVSQGTPEILAQFLIDMSIEGLKERGKDPEKDEIKYAWHYSQATVTDQNSWREAGEKIIKEKYPNWKNLQPDNYYSEQDAEKAISVGEGILDAHKDIDLIICNDSTALPGQLQAMENKKLNKDNVTVTGFSSSNPIKQYAENGTLHTWGLWDCGVQGSMGTYIAAFLAAGNEVKVGDKIEIPEIGTVEVMPNDSIAPDAKTEDKDHGVLLLPERLQFTTENMNDYDF